MATGNRLHEKDLASGIMEAGSIAMEKVSSKASSLPSYRNPSWWVILKAALNRACQSPQQTFRLLKSVIFS
jgi:hypothetical protein